MTMWIDVGPAGSGEELEIHLLVACACHFVAKTWDEVAEHAREHRHHRLIIAGVVPRAGWPDEMGRGC